VRQALVSSGTSHGFGLCVAPTAPSLQWRSSIRNHIGIHAPRCPPFPLAPLAAADHDSVAAFRYCVVYFWSQLHVDREPVWQMRLNEITSADGGGRVLFAFVAQWPAAAEFLR
jgi:hypothetical protein